MAPSTPLHVNECLLTDLQRVCAALQDLQDELLEHTQRVLRTLDLLLHHLNQ